MADRAVLVDQIDGAPVGERRGREAGQRLERGLVVERRRQQRAGLGEHVGGARRLLGDEDASLENVDVEHGHDGAVDLSVARCGRRGCATAASRPRQSCTSTSAAVVGLDDRADELLEQRDVEGRLRLAQRPPDRVAAEIEQQSGGDVEPAHGQVDADEEDRDLHGAEEVLDVVVHPHQRRVAEPELVVERAQLLVGRLQLFLGGLQLLVRAAQLLIARLRFLRRGGGLVGQLLAIVDGGGERVPQAVDLRSLAGRLGLRASPASGMLWNTIQQRPWPGRACIERNHFEARRSGERRRPRRGCLPSVDGGLLAEGAAHRGPQHRQHLVMADQAEEIERGFARFQRDERGDLAANARDLHLFVDQHTAGSEMRGQKGSRPRRGRRCRRAARPARRRPRRDSRAANAGRRRTWPARPAPGRLR